MEELKNENKSNEIKEEKPKNESGICDHCYNNYNNLYIFSCNHKVCAVCLFRRIFIKNLTDFNNTKEEIEIHCKCENGILLKNIDEILEINKLKNTIYENELNEKNPISPEDKQICTIHKEQKYTNYCVDCSKELCTECMANKDNNSIHLNHNILSNEYLVDYLKKELSDLKLNLITKDDFEKKWNDICNKVKAETQKNFDEIMLTIEEVAQAIIDLKNNYEEYYKNELTKIAKKLKLYKLFYLDYYLKKKEAEDTSGINFLRYANSITKELSDIEIKKEDIFYNKLENIKDTLNELKSSNYKFTAEFIFSDISNNFKVQQIIEKAHDKKMNGIFEISNNKVITGGLDYSMKIWQEKDNKFEKIKTIKSVCGAICCMVPMNDGNILTSAANNSNINVWTRQGEDNFIVKQSLSSHTEAVTSLAQLENGIIISGGLDKLIIIWGKDNSGNFIEKQRIKDKKPIILIKGLQNDKFAFSSDSKIRIMIQKKAQPKAEEVNNDNNNENDLINDIFDELDFDQDVEYEKDEENKFIICYRLTKHVGRIRCLLELKNGYLMSGAGDAFGKKDRNIIVWKPNDLNGYYYVQSLSGHQYDINGLIALKDGRVASCSKDRTIRIWKSFIKEEKNNQKVMNFQINEILSEYKHGIYEIYQLKDGRIFCSTSEFSIVIWKDRRFLSYC